MRPMAFVGSLCLTLLGVDVAWSAPPPLDLSSHEKKVSPAANSSHEPVYITDITGKRVRLIGPRFYTNPAKRMQFPGRPDLPAE